MTLAKMYISDLALHNFRSYEEILVSFCPGINILVGDNGVGKTNLVEAIVYLALLNSHRVNNDKAIIRLNNDNAVIQAKINKEEKAYLIEINLQRKNANKAKINRNLVKPKELLGLVKIVIFSPEDIDLVRGDPNKRRDFIDTVLLQQRPYFLEIKSKYEKILKQRTAILKKIIGNKQISNSQKNILEIWNEQLAQIGALIIAARAKIISELRTKVTYFYKEISNSQSFARIDYESNIEKTLGKTLFSAQEYAENKNLEIERIQQEEQIQDIEKVTTDFIKALKIVEKQEILKGQCIVGPHRDEIRLSLGSLLAKGYASHGESWSYALAIRIAQWDLLKLSEEPIIILDDVFAEIDKKRRDKIADLVKNNMQVLVTAAVDEDLPINIESNKLKVSFGKVKTLKGSNEIRGESE